MVLTLKPFGQSKEKDKIESFFKKLGLNLDKKKWRTNLTLLEKNNDQKSNLTLF